jgi:hypothetical protein
MDDGTSTTSSAVGDVTLTLTNGDWDIASAKTATDYSLQMFAWTLSGTSKSNLTLTFTVDGPLTNENGSTLDYELNLATTQTKMSCYSGVTLSRSGSNTYYEGTLKTSKKRSYNVRDSISGVEFTSPQTATAVIDSKTSKLQLQLSYTPEYYYSGYWGSYWSALVNLVATITTTRGGTGTIKLNDSQMGSLQGGRYSATLRVTLSTT